MQNNSVILGGYEKSYMEKLALYLGSRMGEQVTVGMATHPDGDGDSVYIGSEKFISEAKTRTPESKCIILSEDEGEDTICRYQSRERLYQQIMERYQRFYAMPRAARNGRQRWMVLVGTENAAVLTAFSLTCAMILSEKAKALFLNLSAASGMERLFLLERGVDLSDLTEALRRDGEVSLEAYVRQMEGVDFVMPPSNPMILSELREADISGIAEAVARHSEYEYVVVALGHACCGCDRLFRMAERIFLLTKRGHLSDCGSGEWRDFISLCLGSSEKTPERITIPEIEADGSGIHLLHDWREGAIGQLARIYLKGEGKA